MTFWVKSDAAAELTVQLRDGPEFGDEVTTPPVPIVKEKLIDGGAMAGDYRLVVVPMQRLIKDCPDFRPSRLGNVVLSGDGKPPATLWIDRVVFHVSPEGVETERASGGATRAQPRKGRR
jgi:hypothetical protein